MLAQTMFLVSVIAVFAATALAGIAGYTRAQLITSASAQIEPAVEEALAAYQRDVIGVTVGNSVMNATSGPSGGAPAVITALNGGVALPGATYQTKAANGALFDIEIDVTATTAATPVCNAGVAVVPINTGADQEHEAQCSMFVQETRAAVTMEVQIGTIDGQNVISPIAHRRESATLRLFAQPPYSAVVGRKGGATTTQPHEGDSGGYAASASSFGSPVTSDTTIHVIYKCNNATWDSQFAPSDCSNSFPAPQDNLQTIPWSNGNGIANAPGQ